MTQDTHSNESPHDIGTPDSADHECPARVHAPLSRTDPARRRVARTVRWGLLLAVLAASTVLGLLHAKRSGSFWPVGVDALCPFGGLESLNSLILNGTYLKRVEFGSLALLIASVILLAVFGRTFCGRICPLGTLQEIFGRLGNRFLPTRRPVPRWLDRPARFVKYGVLAVFVLWTWRAGELVMRPYDPWAAYHHLTSPELLTEIGVGAVVLLVSLIGSIVYDRFFCRYACPMGAFLGLGAKLSWFKVRRNGDSCIDCGACDTACPVALEVTTAITVDSPECIACGQCVEACPVQGALVVSDRRGRTLSSLMVTAFTFLLFFGLVALSTAAGSFEWTKTTLSQEVQRAGSSGGLVDTESIKGWMSVNDIAEATGLDPKDIAGPFGIQASEYGDGMGELKELHGFEMYDLRDHVSRLLAEPR